MCDSTRHPLAAYRSHKIVHAGRIVSVEPQRDSVVLVIEPAPGIHEAVRREVSREWIARRVSGPASARLGMGGYYVEYPDGYTSWSPADAFEAGYTCLEGDDE